MIEYIKCFLNPLNYLKRIDCYKKIVEIQCRQIKLLEERCDYLESRVAGFESMLQNFGPDKEEV